MGKSKEKTKKKYEIRNWCEEREGNILCLAGLILLIVVIIVTCFVNSLFNKDFSFSLKSGFYADDVNVELRPNVSLFSPGPTFKYNLNGDDLAETSSQYSESIRLEAPETGYNLYTITAMACYGDECTAPKVATYVLGKNLKEDITMDIVSINSSQKNLYDYDTGIMVAGRLYDEYKDENLGKAHYSKNYFQRGKEWERDANFVVLSNSGEEKDNKKVNLMISGRASLDYSKMSFKIVSNDENSGVGYGLGFDKDYKSLRIRLGQDYSYGNIRSSVASRLMQESGFSGQAQTKRVVVFLNGDYYGVADVQQNYSSEYLRIANNLDDGDMIETFKGDEVSVYTDAGVSDLFNKDLNNHINREQLEACVDMDNYLKYYAIQIAWNNTDWPGNNFEVWRYSYGSSVSALKHLVYDEDLIYYSQKNDSYLLFEGSISDVFQNLMEDKNNGAGSTFKHVMSSVHYREKFIGYLRELMDGPFKTSNVLRIIDEEAAKIDHQMMLFGTDEEYEEWQEWVAIMRETASKREGEIRADVKKYFGIDL